MISLTNLHVFIDKLELSQSSIYKIDGVEHFKNVSQLDISKNHIQNISFIADMNYITYLDLSYNNIDDTMSLAKLTELSHLDISHNKLDDLIGLENHHYLKSLNLSNNLLKVKNDDDDPSMFGPLFYYPENVIMDIDRNLISEPDFITWNLRHRANFQLEITPTIHGSLQHI